ncbi:MAG: aspartate-semialdehyde dehydrogenase [Planctomycetota bacterium]|nr:MAG: aspartate-semialdehyde dehydrogenase [Planctomycetota bacterium]
MKKPVVAVVGATGLVGEVLLQIMQERRFEVAELRPLASRRSAGSEIRFQDRNWPVKEANGQAFENCDLVFFAATGSLSRDLAPEAVKQGAVVIDKSGTWRMEPQVPLVVPEINGDQILSKPGIIACPNCSTIGFTMALEALRRRVGLKRVVVTTLQAVSGTGKDGLNELQAQRAGQAEPQIFPHAIDDNVIPQCEGFRDDGFTTEEVKLLFETRKIMNLPQLEVSMTCVRVPVQVGHSASILVETEQDLDPQQARQALREMPGVMVIDDPSTESYPTPEAVKNSDAVMVGRIRSDFQHPRRLWLWQVANNLRKGAATNAVQIAEILWPQSHSPATMSR